MISNTSLSGLFKSYGIWLIIILFTVFNIALLRQNLQMRSQLESYQPKELKIGDKVQGFVAKNLNGESVNIDSPILPRNDFFYISRRPANIANNNFLIGRN